MGHFRSSESGLPLNCFDPGPRHEGGDGTTVALRPFSSSKKKNKKNPQSDPVTFLDGPKMSVYGVMYRPRKTHLRRKKTPPALFYLFI